jgi:NADH-quinone oxidoreductase subunit H
MAAISSLAVYGIILGGWSSNSKYAFLGSLRSAAQMVSYEVSLGLILMTILLCVGSLNLTEIVYFQRELWFVVPFFPLFIMFFISGLAETNRPPFDLPEAEAELVSGYNVEYSSVGFAFFFIGEYANIIFLSALSVVLFFGGWYFPFIDVFFIDFPFFKQFVFSVKVFFFLYFFICVRAVLPRYRYDQLMKLGWKVFLPFSLGWIFLVSGSLLAFQAVPLSFFF